MWTAGDDKDRGGKRARDDVDGKTKETRERRGKKLRRQGDNI